MKTKLTIQFLLLMLISQFFFSAPVFAADAVASIKGVSGSTFIERGSKTIAARKGLILYDQDIIVTRNSAKATIVFRDGSTIRLYPNTRFLIEKSIETQKGSRRFFNNFRLKVGSFWGKFTKRNSETVINTPTATAGIKGTNVSFMERNNRFSAALSTGRVEISNDTQTLDLSSGQMVKELSRVGSIEDRVMPLPNQLVITPDKTVIQLPASGQKLDLSFTLQLVNSNTNVNVSRPGEVFITHQPEIIQFEPDIELNDRGYARIRGVIAPTRLERTTNRIEIWAVLEGEDNFDVKSGNTFLTIKTDKKKSRKIRIDAESGIVD